MGERLDLPAPSAPNFAARVRETLMTYLGRQGDALNRGLTLRDLLEADLVRLREGFRPGLMRDPLPLEAGAAIDPTPDLTPPPTPTGFTVSAAISHVFVEHAAAAYAQGHGHLRTHLYGATVQAGGALPTFGQAVALAQFAGTVHAHPSNPATAWRLWITWESQDGVQSAVPAGGTHGLAATTGQDVSLLLDALTGSITESQLFQTLGSRIDLIDAAGTGLVTKVADLQTTYGNTTTSATHAAQAAQSAAAAVVAQTAALLAQSGAETAKDAAVTAKTNAETAAASASTSATQSSQSATGAAGSAASASTSATTAANSATAAGGSATAAATSATNASTYATAAETASSASTAARVAAESARDAATGSATAAATSAATATTKATEAGQSAASASTSATHAQTSAASASTSATNASTSATSAAGSASAASTSATLAATSANAAGGSATAAAGSASSASTSATDAANAATAANTTRVAAESAATNAATSASAAATSASTASTQANAAGQSATTASTAATQASTSQAEALAYRNQASTSATNAAGSAAAAAQDFSTVNARLNNAGGTGVTVEAGMSAQANSISGLSGQYTVKIDANGYVTGFGLASSAVNGVPTSSFILRADKFSIANPAGPGLSPIVPFVVNTTPETINGVLAPAGVYMDAAYLKNGTLTAAKIANATIDDAKIASLSAAKITAGTLSADRIAAGSLDAKIANLDAAVITAGTLGTARIGQASIGAAQIANAAVDTLKIAGNAVTIPVVASVDNAQFAGPVSITNDFGGSFPVFLQMTMRLSDTAVGPFQLTALGIGYDFGIYYPFNVLFMRTDYNVNAYNWVFSCSASFNIPAYTTARFWAGAISGGNYYTITFLVLGCKR